MDHMIGRYITIHPCDLEVQSLIFSYAYWVLHNSASLLHQLTWYTVKSGMN